MNKKILFLIENATYGGGEKSFSQLIRHLPKAEFEFFVATLPEGKFFNEINDFSKIIEFDLRNRFNIFNVLKLVKIIKKIQ
jgi:hypothetical protein